MEREHSNQDGIEEERASLMKLKEVCSGIALHSHYLLYGRLFLSYSAGEE